MMQTWRIQSRASWRASRVEARSPLWAPNSSMWGPVASQTIGPHLSQQDGFLHAGIVVAALDSACGYAALTVMPDDADVLTVELKVNLLAPANGDRLLAEGDVLRAVRTLTVCRGDAYAEQGSERVHVSTMLATMMRRRAGPVAG
jgi:uncharacterized protein (TIGR00369 family)